MSLFTTFLVMVASYTVALLEFGNTDIMAFFEGMGIALKEEDRGRMFPVSDKAKSVVDALINRVKQSGVSIRINTPVKRVLYADGKTTGIELSLAEKSSIAAVSS